MTPTVAQVAEKAMRAHREGRLEEAEALCRHALDSDPDHYKSLVHLAVLLRHKGQFGDSANLAERAITLQPETSDGYVQLGLCLLGSGRPQEAANILLRAVSLSPAPAPLHYSLGLALENSGRPQEAKAAFVEACRLAPSDVTARLSLGSILLREGDLLGARSQAEAALKLDPGSAPAHLQMAKLLVAEGKGSRAEESIRWSLSIDPEASFGHTMLGFRLLQKGDFEEAEASFKRSLELDGAQGLASFGITQARKMTEADRPMIERMRVVLRGTPLTLEQAGYLHFGLAKALENLGDYEDAMNHFNEAHQSAALFKDGGAPFDASQYGADIAAVKRTYTRELFDTPGESFESDLPILIVGMMRSGTTLTEQILSSHPNIGAAGEQEFWAKRGHLAEDLAKTKVDRKLAVTLARDYCKELRKISPGTPRVTDKLPGNYLRLGLLHLALPNARIIHCRRNPVDTALSIYFTANPNAPAFSHTREGIVYVYRQYQALMQHWRELLPAGRFHEVQYEELVSEPERVIRSMLEFLGLEWNDACLKHEKNAKEVHTPSLWQVRQPMYTSSVERWRRYEPWLGAFRELLS